MLDIKKIGAALLAALALAGCGKNTENDGGQPDDTPFKLSVMSFNIRNSLVKGDTGDRLWSNRKESVRKMVQETVPDIIGMQEASSAQRKDLTAMLPDYALLEVPNTGTSKGGNTVILFNTKVLDNVACKSFYLSSTPNKPSVNGWNTETQYRTTIWGEFRHKGSGRTFFLADTHMPLYSTVEGNLARTKSAELNVGRMKEACGEDAPVFIVGDMNCSKPEAGIQPYLDWMSSARDKALASDDIPSFNNFGGSGNSRIDFIFYRNAIPNEFRTVNGGGYGVKYISDHYPIMAKFTIL